MSTDPTQHRAESRTQLSLDTQFDILANTTRRQLLIALLERDSKDDEGQIHATSVTDGSQAAMIALSHIHLPKLEATGVISWDRDSNEVREGPQFGAIKPLLHAVSMQSDERAQ